MTRTPDQLTTTGELAILTGGPVTGRQAIGEALARRSPTDNENLQERARLRRINAIGDVWRDSSTTSSTGLNALNVAASIDRARLAKKSAEPKQAELKEINRIIAEVMTALNNAAQQIAEAFKGAINLLGDFDKLEGGKEFISQSINNSERNTEVAKTLKLRIEISAAAEEIRFMINTVVTTTTSKGLWKKTTNEKTVNETHSLNLKASGYSTQKTVLHSPEVDGINRTRRAPRKEKSYNQAESYEIAAMLDHFIKQALAAAA